MQIFIVLNVHKYGNVFILREDENTNALSKIILQRKK